MRFLSRLRLSQRFAVLITISIVTSSAILILYAEEGLEKSMLEQTKKQVVAYLLDLEDEFQREGVADSAAVQRMVDNARQHFHKIYDFCGFDFL